MANKIRVGFVGANVKSHWASASHFPALRASPDLELTAVCTTNSVSAEEARKAFGAKLAFSDYREMVASPEIDAVLVVVRVPSHFQPTIAAIEAGKHVYTEWPLGLTTAEAEEMTSLARAKGVQTAVGLQSRVLPALMHMKDLVASGYVGEVLACHVSAIRPGPLERAPDRLWFGDVKQGAHQLTISTGHVVDTMRFVVGDLKRLGAIVSSQVKQWRETGTNRVVDITAPDNILLNCELLSGAVASVHVSAIPWAPSGYRMEIYGNEGALVASSSVSSNHGRSDEMLRLRGAKKAQNLEDIEIPKQLSFVPEGFPMGTPLPVGQMYALFAQAVRTGKAPKELPTFATALEMHRIINAIQQSSDTRAMVDVPIV